MGFFSNIIKKIGKFVTNVFRDVEKPIMKVEDIGLKEFREFEEFIEKPIEKIEEAIEEPEEEIEYYRKIVKTTGYSFGRKDTLYALTFEDNNIDRSKELKDKILDEFSNSHGILERFGYDSEYYGEISSITYQTKSYPEIEVGIEWFD